MKRGFVNQKLGKRNSRRAALLKANAFSWPSPPKSKASKSFETNEHAPAR